MSQSCFVGEVFYKKTYCWAEPKRTTELLPNSKTWKPEILPCQVCEQNRLCEKSPDAWKQKTLQP